MKKQQARKRRVPDFLIISGVKSQYLMGSQVNKRIRLPLQELLQDIKQWLQETDHTLLELHNQVNV